MRTRFLPTDYSAANTGGDLLEALGLLRLPLPDLPPPDYPSLEAKLLHFLDDIPFLGIFCEFDKLPIDDALSIFLSDVLPHCIDGGEAMVDTSKEKHEVLQSEENYGTDCKDMDGDGLKFMQYESPEMDIPLLSPKTTLHSQISCLHILTEIPDSSPTLDQLNYELTLHDHAGIEQLLYSVDEMNLEYSMEEKGALLLGRANSFQEEVNSYNSKFPLFEVDITSTDILGRMHNTDEISIFENIEKQEMAKSDDITRNNMEILGSMEFDLIKYLFHHPVVIQCLKKDPEFASQLDLISIIELSHCHEYSTCHLEGPDDNWIQSVDPIVFDEFLFFDVNPYLFYEMFSDAAKAMEIKTYESLFGETMNFRGYSELIISQELTLVDDSFTALPVPIFSSDGNNNSLHVLLEELFSQLDWQSSSTSDALYLDWCFLEDDCEPDKYSSCQKMLWEIDTCYTDVTNLSDSEQVIFDFMISEGHSAEPNPENYEETSNFSCGNVLIFKSTGNMDRSSLRNPGDGQNPRDGKDIKADIMKTSIENVSMLGESMSSDLEFFLNPRNYSGRESKHAHKSIDSDALRHMLEPTDDSAAPTATTPGVQQKWNVRVYQIWLSDAIQRLIDYLWEDFLVLLENDKEFIHVRHQYEASNDLKLLHIPNEKLKRRLGGNASSTYLAHNDNNTMVLAMLFAIKQMAFSLCYYGIQVTYLYLERIRANLPCMRSRLNSFHNLIQDENLKAEKELTLLHPSIAVVQEILKMELTDSNAKILIVCDQIFMWALKRLLASLKISFNEPPHQCTPSCQHHCFEITDAVANITRNWHCCLASYEYVSASFPFSKFSSILECGGANVSSRISSICTVSNGLPNLYFLMVELEGSTIARALSYGVDMPKNIKLEVGSNSDSASAQKESKTTLEELLCTIPFKETYGKFEEAAQRYEQCNKMPFQSLPVGSEPKENLLCKPICANTVIIVNTRNFNEEMVISRRSTYQRILEMERGGAQIVERDIDLPADIILSSAASLTWYDHRNIGKKVSAPDEAFSCLPLCVESIATSTLMSLSFAFSCCILIFEGEGSFLCSIMESSDELYAAAASLGIDLQVFCSHSSDMTEEIILSCINVAAELTRGLYLKMSDTESLAESFLTSFPSIHSLTAHAILSSDLLLGKFLELSYEDRICALQRYKVPNESIALLSAVSRYGEREDSKSGVTDCSSSLSIPDSENVQFKSVPEMRKPDYTHSVYNNGSTEISNRLEEFNLSLDEMLLDFSQDTDVNVMKTIDNSSRYNFPLGKGLQISDQNENPWNPQFDLGCSPRQKTDISQKSNIKRRSVNATSAPQENFTGEVTDVDNTPAFQADFFATESFSLFDIEKGHSARNYRMSKHPFSTTGLPIFPSPEIGSACGTISTNEKRRATGEEIRPHFDNINKNNISITYQKRLMEQSMTGKAPQNFHKVSSQEKDTSISNALDNTTQVQQGSPWTIEFLNRIREKSRLRRQSASYELSPPCLGSSGNTLKGKKRKSPSILEFYKYEKGSSSTPQKTFDQKKLKRSSQLEKSLKNKKAPTSYPPSCTPVDKRARRVGDE